MQIDEKDLVLVLKDVKMVENEGQGQEVDQEQEIVLDHGVNRDSVSGQVTDDHLVIKGFVTTLRT